MADSKLAQSTNAIQTSAPSPNPSQLLTNAAAPMASDEFARFSSQLANDWNAVARQSAQVQRQAASPIGASPLQSEMRRDESHVEPTRVQEIYNWLDDTLLEHIEKDPRTHATVAMREFLMLPGSKEDLLSFFRDFAAAYEELLRKRTRLSVSNIESSYPQALLAQAGMHNALFKQRLDRLAKMASDRPEAAELFRLAIFAGCSAEEIASYHNCPVHGVANRIQRHVYDVYEE